MDAVGRDIDRCFVVIEDRNDQPIFEHLFPVPDNSDVRKPLSQFIITTDQFLDVPGRITDLKVLEDEPFRYSIPL